MEFRRRHGCLRNQAMRGLRISSSTPPDAAPSLSLRHGTGSSSVRMAFLYALLQSIGGPLQRRSQLASMSDMPHLSLLSRTARLDRLERRHLRPSAPEQPWRPDVARSAPVLPSLEWETIKRAEVAHSKTLLLRAGSPKRKGWSCRNPWVGFRKQPDQSGRGHGHLAHQLPLRWLRGANSGPLLISPAN
jgi:hypothetical protein